MNLLAIDSSSIAGSVAYIKDDKLAGEYYFCDKLTHSQTIMPMLEHMKTLVPIDLETLDAIAVTSGPGSFTGLRIGVTAAKALAFALEVPIIGVPTLDCLAYNFYFTEHFICPIMDARRNQVYTSLYQWKEYKLERLLDYLAIDLNEHLEKIQLEKQKVIFLGDGIIPYKETIQDILGEQAVFAPPFLSQQRASTLATIAMDYYQQGKVEDPSLFVPMYLRKSQAERERQAREHGH